MSETPLFRQVQTVDFRTGTHDWPFARDEMRRIDGHWRARLEKQPSLFDGRVYLATAVEMDAGVLRATAFETAYRNFIAWRDFGFPGGDVFNLFAMAALQSAEGAFMMGEMGPDTASAGLRYFPAGTPDPADAKDGFVDLEANVRRELREETGIGESEIEVDPGWHVVHDGARIACMKPMRSLVPAVEILRRFGLFCAAETDPELAALIPVLSLDGLDAARMPRFMTTYLRARFDPAAVAETPDFNGSFAAQAQCQNRV